MKSYKEVLSNISKEVDVESLERAYNLQKGDKSYEFVGFTEEGIRFFLIYRDTDDHGEPTANLSEEETLTWEGYEVLKKEAPVLIEADEKRNVQVERYIAVSQKLVKASSLLSSKVQACRAELKSLEDSRRKSPLTKNWKPLLEGKEAEIEAIEQLLPQVKKVNDDWGKKKVQAHYFWNEFASRIKMIAPTEDSVIEDLEKLLEFVEARLGAEGED